MSPTEELRKAAAVLRCDHSFSADLPHSIFAPGPCGGCGVPFPGDLVSPGHLKEPLAAVLERLAVVRGRIQADCTFLAEEAALVVARQINGTTGEEQP